MAKTLAETYNDNAARDTNPSSDSTNFASYASILTNLESQLSDTSALGDVTLDAGLELALNDLVAYLDTTRTNPDAINDTQVYVKSGNDTVYFGKNWYFLLEITDFLRLPAELQSLLEAVDATREELTGADSLLAATTTTGSFREIVILLALYTASLDAYIPDVDKLTLKNREANSVSVRDGATLIEIDTTEVNDTSNPIEAARLKSQEENTNNTSGKYFHANDFGLYYVNAAEKVNLIYPASFDKENREEHNLIMVLIKENGDEQEINFTVLVRDRTAPNSPPIDATLFANESQKTDGSQDSILDSNNYAAQVTYDEPVDVTVHNAAGESTEVEVVTSDNKTFTLKIKRTRASLAGRTISGLYLKAVDRDIHYNLASYTNRFDLVFKNMAGTVETSEASITHSQIRDEFADTSGVSNINVLTVAEDSNEAAYSMSLDSVTGPNSEDAIEFFTQDGLKVDLNLTDTNKSRNEFLGLRGDYSIQVTVTEAVHDSNTAAHTHTVTKYITITDDLAILITQDTNNFTGATYVGGMYPDTTPSGTELFTIPAVVFDAYGDAASVSVKADTNQDSEYVQAELDSNGVIAITTKTDLSLNHNKDTYTFTLLIDDDSSNGATELEVQFSTSDDSAPEIESLVSSLASAGGSTNINPLPMTLKLKNNEPMGDMTSVSIAFAVAGGSSGSAQDVLYNGDEATFLISLQPSDDGKEVTVTATVKKDSLTDTNDNSDEKTFTYTYDITVDNSFAFVNTDNKVITINNRTEYSVLKVTDFVVGGGLINTSEYTFGHSGFSGDFGKNVTSEKHYTFYTFTDNAGNVAALVQEILVNNFGAAADVSSLVAEIGSLSKVVNVTLPSGNSYALSSDSNDNGLFTLDTNKELTLKGTHPAKTSYSLEIVATNDASQNTKTETLTVTVEDSGTPTLTIVPVDTNKILDSADTNTPVKLADVSASFTDRVSGNAIALDHIEIESVVGTYRTGYADEQFPTADTTTNLSDSFSIETNGDLYQKDDLDDAVIKVTIKLKVAANLDSSVSATAEVEFTVNDTTTPVLKFKDTPAENSDMLSYTKTDDENAVATFIYESTLNMLNLLDVSETLETTTGITTSITLSGDNTADDAPASLTELTSTLGTFAVKQTRKDAAGNTSNEVTLTITIVQPATIDLVHLNAQQQLTITLNVDGLYDAPEQLKLPEVHLDMKASAFDELFTVTLPEDGINEVEKILAERVYVQEAMTFGVDAANKLPHIMHHANGETIAHRTIVQDHVTESDKKFHVPEGASQDNFGTPSFANYATFTYYMHLMEGVEGLEEATNYQALRTEIINYFADHTTTGGGYKQDIIDILDDSNNPTNNDPDQEKGPDGNRKNYSREVFFQILKAEHAVGGGGPRLTKKGVFKNEMAPLKYPINFQEGDTLTFTVGLKDADGENQYGQDTNTNRSKDGNTVDLAAANRQVLVRIRMIK